MVFQEQTNIPEHAFLVDKIVMVDRKYPMTKILPEASSHPRRRRTLHFPQTQFSIRAKKNANQLHLLQPRLGPLLLSWRCAPCALSLPYLLLSPSSLLGNTKIYGDSPTESNASGGCRLVRFLDPQNYLIWCGDRVIISSSWWRRWQKYVAFHDILDHQRSQEVGTSLPWPPQRSLPSISQEIDSFHPGPIDNEELLLRPNELKKNVFEGIDYVLLPESAGKMLHEVFGGAEMITRKV
jgi:hypothetical protein